MSISISTLSPAWGSRAGSQPVVVQTRLTSATELDLSHQQRTTHSPHRVRPFPALGSDLDPFVVESRENLE